MKWFLIYIEVWSVELLLVLGIILNGDLGNMIVIFVLVVVNMFKKNLDNNDFCCICIYFFLYIMYDLV